jgi:carboxypeptidase C (cathepsin A)
MAPNNNQQPETRPSVFSDNLVVTHHSIKIADREVRYTATTGTIVLKEERRPGKSQEKEQPAEFEQPKAAVFFVAYTREGIKDAADRPITFSFNGGPGSSSVWLHMGLLGPQRVWMDEAGHAPPPPYRLVDNEYSLLDVTDLVFIDPVSTGFSRAVPGEDESEFHGFQRDIESVGDFIRLYTSRYNRWASPKFLIGESYGTTRAAGLSGYLQDRHGFYLNGIMLISAVLNFQTHNFDPANDLPYILFLPTYCATAWYHQQLPEDLQRQPLADVLATAEQFALGEYQQALSLGTALPEQERQQMIAQLARFTGLSADYLDHSDLRIEIFQFCKELLRHEKRTIGRLDTRFKGRDRQAVGLTPEFDPSYTNIQGPYTAMLNHYMRSELAFESDLPYEILTGRVQPWSYKEHENKYVDVSETLRKAIAMNPHLRVFIGSGYLDLATPYFATQYTVNHLSLDPELQGNVSISHYEAGHMMYIHLPSLDKLRHDLVQFIAMAVPAG